MAEGESGEKKHTASERRLRRAREHGEIRRSADLPRAALTALLVLATVALGGVAANTAYTWLMTSIRLAGRDDLSRAWDVSWGYGIVLAAFLLTVAVLALLIGSLSGGWIMTLGGLVPKLDSLSPSRSWGQVFSVTNLIEVGKSILKVLVVGGAGLLAFRLVEPSFLALAASHSVALSTVGMPAFLVIAAATLGAVALAGADMGLQAWLNRRALRMSDRELREELKEEEGDPQIRARRRALLRRQARARQVRAVRTASVIVTNPTHYAVAIRYRRDLDPVPMVVAKGTDLTAISLLDEARQWGIPLVEAPPLARALSRFVEVDHPIPPGLYRAVAEVLAYIWRLDQWRAGAGSRPHHPQFPDRLVTFPDER